MENDTSTTQHISYVVARQMIGSDEVAYGETMYLRGSRYVMHIMDATIFHSLSIVLDICLGYNDKDTNYHYFPKQLVTEVFDV